MKSDVHIAQVIIDHNNLNTDKLFDYEIPAHLLQVVEKGMRVVVPFGKGNKKLEGYVFDIEIRHEKKDSLKQIIDVIDHKPILSQDQIEMILWMKNKYLCRYIEAIRCILPTGMIYKEKKRVSLIHQDWDSIILKSAKKQRQILETLSELGGTASFDELNRKLSFKDLHGSLQKLEENRVIRIDYILTSRVKAKKEKYVEATLKDGLWEKVLATLSKRAAKQKEIIEFLRKHKQCKLDELLVIIGTTRSTIKALEKKGYVRVIEKECRRNPFENCRFEPFPKLNPSPEQKAAIDQITKTIEKNESEIYLIHGVTGSGKTEIYLQLVEEVNRRGKQGIVLVPEIALTPQTVQRFRGRFGDHIAVLHSHLSDGERYDEWRRILEGKVNIVIGARSAVFAPLNHLGIIIIDEEHEHTYKSEQNPKYHAIEIAAYRSMKENAVVVLGSATPSLETYFKAKRGDLRLINLNQRATNAPLPKVEIVDMKQELDSGNKEILSKKLLSLMEETLNMKKQIILFLNRRGYSTFVFCKKCGYVIKCSRCDISMTLHMPIKILQCHYCGNRKQVPVKCPSCGSDHIEYYGTGTQKLESIIKAYFPRAVIGRMDMDSTIQKGSHEKILEQFKKGKINILVGTQMITKGLDFPNVTLVGIIAADAILNLPDFRAPERAFQLITQVSGRAGRGIEEGTVILQTYDPQHYSIIAAAEHNYIQFYNEEITLRKEFLYPPFVQLITIHFSGRNETLVYDTCKKMVHTIRYILQSKGYNDIEEIVFGPNECMVKKVNQNYRYQILLKDYQVKLSFLKGIIKYIFIENRNKFIPKEVTVSININPYSIA